MPMLSKPCSINADVSSNNVSASLGLKLAETDQMTLADERKYWRYLYQLFAYGQVDADFPAIKLAKEAKEGKDA